MKAHELPFLANMSRAQLETMLLTANTGSDHHVVKRGNRIIRVMRVETIVYASTIDGQSWYVQAEPNAVRDHGAGALAKLRRWWFGARQAPGKQLARTGNGATR